MSGKTIRTVTVDDEQQTGAPVVLPIGSDVVGAHRDPDTGVLQLVVIHGAAAKVPMTVAVHVVEDNAGYVPARGRYLATVDGRHRPVHVFLAPHRPISAP